MNRIVYIIGKKLKIFYPSIQNYLIQAGINKKVEEFLGRTFLESITLAISVLVILFLISKSITISLLTSFTTFLFVYFELMNLPKYKSLIKKKKIENQIMFAVNELKIKLSSGVPLFNSLKGIATGEYGTLSSEISKVVKRIESGESEEDALKELATTSPSSYLRKVAWQIVISLRTGGDIANALDAVLNELEKEREIRMKKYINTMNLYLLIYMVISIILPILFIVAGLVLSTLSFINIPFYSYYLIPIIIGIFEFMLIGFIKSERPPEWRD